MPSSTPTTTTAPLASAAVSSPEEYVAAAMVCARTCAVLALSTATSMRSAVRCSTAWARMTGAPTTDSATAPSSSPTRSRTSRYASCSRCCRCRTARNSGRKHAYTSSVSCQDQNTISAVASSICAVETTMSRPPHCMNVLIVSTSPVTRETSDPRRSVAWCSTDRSCTRRNARTRSAASPPSVAR